jgi:hypothetical protein
MAQPALWMKAELWHTVVDSEWPLSRSFARSIDIAAPQGSTGLMQGVRLQQAVVGSCFSIAIVK